MTLNVIDIASYQKTLVPSKVPADAIIIKATEGTGYINPTFKTQAAQTLAAGKKLGLYHFIHTAATGSAQADYFVANIKPYIGKALLVLDFESTTGSNVRTDAMVAQGKAFLDRVYALTSVRPVVYTNTDFEQHLDWSAVVKGNYGLWIAQYNTTSPITGFKPRTYTYKLVHWPSLTMFQYHDNTHISGYSGGLDASIFYGDRATWDKYAAANGKPVPAPSKPAPAAKPTTTGSASIKAVQQWLNSAYGTGLVVDGIKGPRTMTALTKALQKELNIQFHFGLAVDGIKGARTKAAMAKVIVKQGDQGAITKLIQGNLIARGYDPKGFDGVYGAGMASAVKAFQKVNRLTQDGVAGKNTLITMFV